jgi:hypothetical protein
MKLLHCGDHHHPDVQVPDRGIKMWVIYANPSDFPGKCVVREHVIAAGGIHGVEEQPAAVVSTLAEARAAVPRGLTRLPRDPDDDLAIVEAWI